MSSRYLVHSINKLGTSTSVILRGSQRRFSIPLLCVKLRSSYRYLYFNGCGQDFIQSESVPMAENWRHRGFRGWVVLNSSLFTRNFFFSSSRTKFLPLSISSSRWKNKQRFLWYLKYTPLGICSDLDSHNANGSEHKSLSMYFFPFVPNRKGLVSILQVLSGFIESSEEETIGHGIFYNSQPVLEEQIAACNHGRNRNLFGSRSFEAAPPRVWKWNAW